MYNYENERLKIYSEEGFEMFIKIRDEAKRLLDQAGAFRLDKVISKVAGESFMMLACIDNLVEQGKIKEVSQSGISTQHKIYTGRH